MPLNVLTAISPLDGRYWGKLENLSFYFSEFALIKHRIKIEVLYLIKLSEVGVVRKFSSQEKKLLKSLSVDFKLIHAGRVKKIEKKINHDVKAVEYFIKERINKTSLNDLYEFVHFALTSEDVSNLAYSLMIKDFLQDIYLPQIQKLVAEISKMALQNKSLVMLSRTHGQPASPTTLGKELAIFVYRLKKQLTTLPQLTGKLNGAVGNYNAHQAAFPKVNWIKFSRQFIKSLGLEPNLITTQIESHDRWSELFHSVMRINNILLDFDRDLWGYISLNYLKQKQIKNEVGSSTMPHKINPIDFENSEGNLGMANALFQHFSAKLPISRFQRDLSDSTVSRNIGSAFAYSILAYQAVLKGLAKIAVNQEVIAQDLQNHPEILAEAIQVILRKEGVKTPYENLKKLTRNKKIKLSDLDSFIDGLQISSSLKKKLKKLTAQTYVGLAQELINQIKGAKYANF